MTSEQYPAELDRIEAQRAAAMQAAGRQRTAD